MSPIKKTLGKYIFMSRWLQLPLYLGLIVTLGAYIYRFLKELFDLVTGALGWNDTSIMLGILELIDVVMIANLLIMVILGGYETFIASLHVDSHPDHPEWLDHLDAGAMKVKLALSLIGISSIHLLATFIDPTKLTDRAIMWQVVIHITLVASAIAIAFTNKTIEHKSPS
jgi:uncharacterized protein (TIGR00645 family)